MNLSKQTDPVTSHIAGDQAICSGLVETHEKLIYEAVEKYPGHTAAEIGAACGLTQVQVNQRTAHMKSVIAGSRKECSIQGSYCLTWWPCEA